MRGLEGSAGSLFGCNAGAKMKGYGMVLRALRCASCLVLYGLGLVLQVKLPFFRQWED